MFATSVFEPSTSCLIPLVRVGTEFMNDCVPAESWLAPALSAVAPAFNVSLFDVSVFAPVLSADEPAFKLSTPVETASVPAFN